MDEILNTDAEILDSTQNYYDVSICIISYNKSKYIPDAIQSVLMQETVCSYEIVIGDNASDDGTQDLLKKYHADDPEKFCLIFNRQNLGLTANMFNTMCKAKGKYIIILYADDYWIDPSKLQRQFEFMESHPAYVGVSTPLEYRYDGEDNGFKQFPPGFMYDKPVNLDRYLNGYDFPMAGLMFRKQILTDNIKHFQIMTESSPKADDASFCILILMKGDIFLIGKITAVYRCFRENAGASNYNSVNTAYMRCENSIELLNNLDRLTGNSLDLGVRYGFILTSAFSGILSHKITLSQYAGLTKKMNAVYKNRHLRLLFKGVCRKMELKIRK